MTVSTATLQADVLSTLGYASTDSVLLARALKWLNEAMDDVLFYYPDAEFFQKAELTLDTISGQAAYPMPTDFLALDNLLDVDNQNDLTIMTREFFDREHPDPASETNDSPKDATLEYDRNNNRNILRLAPTPDDAYTLKAILKVWHPALSSTQNIIWDKLEYVIKRRAQYYGALELYNTPDDLNYRQEINMVSMEKLKGLRSILSNQKPRPRQVPVVLKKSDY